MSLKIVLVYDLRNDYLAQGFTEEQVAEFDTEETIFLLERAIQSLGYQTERIGNIWALAPRVAAGEKWDLVFNIAEGLGGRCRESQVPAILEAYNIGYTFSDPMVCAITLDKAVAKRIIRNAGLPTPKFKVVESIEDIEHVGLEYPLFAKPNAEGTGKGIDHNSQIQSPSQLITVCRDLLETYQQPVLVEEFLPGREFTVGLLGNGDDAYVIGIMEIVIPRDSKAIYSYVAKEQCETLVKYQPLRTGLLADQIRDLAIKCYKALQCRDAARVDIRCDKNGLPCFIEINPLAGLHPTHSDLPMIATQEGIKYEHLIDQIINNALKRLERRIAV